MLNILSRPNGLNIVGQGGKIILFTLPALAAAILAQLYIPRFAALPAWLGLLKPAGYLLLAPGLLLWGAAVIQLLTGFSRGSLVTTGAYGVVRNPIYASVIWFILPGVALLTLSWVYLVPAACLYLGVLIFIGVEERQLLQVFGSQYQVYLTRVDRLIPFKNP
ncbi:MAG TPA: methyltransferase [Anaerolineales bacterium]|nr:methyltransferase [Anaerolineales bacterium]